MQGETLAERRRRRQLLMTNLAFTVVAAPNRYVSVQPFRRALARLDELLDDIKFDLRSSAFDHSQRFGR